MSSRIFQSVIIQMKEATDRCIGVIDDQGFVVACSELSMIGSRLEDFRPVERDIMEQVIVSNMRTYKLIGINGGKFDYAVFVEGTDDMSRSACVLAAFFTHRNTISEKFTNSAYISIENRTKMAYYVKL